MKKISMLLLGCLLIGALNSVASPGRDAPKTEQVVVNGDLKSAYKALVAESQNIQFKYVASECEAGVVLVLSVDRLRTGTVYTRILTNESAVKQINALPARPPTYLDCLKQCIPGAASAAS